MEVTPFAFEEHLVRVTHRNGEPWFVGKDVCEALSIRNHNDALAKLDEDERGVGLTDPRERGGVQETVIVSEPGVYRLTFSSRKPEAERFKRWLAHDVLPSLRKIGRYGTGAEPAPLPTSPRDDRPQSFGDRINAVRECRLVFGRERAKELWAALALPCVPDAPPTAYDEARACLLHLLMARLEGGMLAGDLIERALEDDLEAAALLASYGMRVLHESGGFFVPNRPGELARVFAGSRWDHGRFARVLRRLPGTSATGPFRIGGGQTRGTFIPEKYLDFGVL